MRAEVGELDDMLEIGERIVRCLLAVERRNGWSWWRCRRAGRCSPSGAAFATRLAPVIPPAPPDILDHHLLSEGFAQALRHDAADRIDRPACRVRHDHRDGPRRPVLREGGA
jgi:hypothetical protein